MLDTKKDLIINCIKLGMDFYKSAICASCTKGEIEQLEKDEQFQNIIEVHKAIVEKELLVDHQSIIEDAVLKGNAAPLQWKLERLNPGQWGNRTKIDVDKTSATPVNINFIRGTKEGE